ncbi:glycosyltransferase, partial [Escherichia coli]|nr:glycosyltransferase [Escherichia coli]
SKRTPFWEELFGMVLIEAMACGCIPLCTDHNGPSIILGHSTLKINVFSEDEYIQSVNASFKKYQNQPHLLVEDRINAIAIAQKYSKESIADFWAAVIKLAKE